MTLVETLRKEGSKRREEEVVRNALNEGLEPGFIAKLTGYQKLK
ncbi:hypothetical protein [Virgibacillus salidurans]|nr:hypothetical protein [Virgibacillus sp. NKC19-16]